MWLPAVVASSGASRQNAPSLKNPEQRGDLTRQVLAGRAGAALRDGEEDQRRDREGDRRERDEHRAPADCLDRELGRHRGDQNAQRPERHDGAVRERAARLRHPQHHRLETAHQPAGEAEPDQGARARQGRAVPADGKQQRGRQRRKRAAPPAPDAGRSGRAGRQAAIGTGRTRTDRPTSADPARRRPGRDRRPDSARRPRSPPGTGSTGSSRARTAPAPSAAWPRACLVRNSPRRVDTMDRILQTGAARGQPSTWPAALRTVPMSWTLHRPATPVPQSGQRARPGSAARAYSCGCPVTAR